MQKVILYAPAAPTITPKTEQAAQITASTVRFGGQYLNTHITSAYLLYNARSPTHKSPANLTYPTQNNQQATHDNGIINTAIQITVR